MKKHLNILILLSTLICFSQDKKEIEELMNVAYKEIVQSNYTYFNLIDSSQTILLKQSDFDRFDKTFWIDSPDFDKKEFIAKAASAQKINWRDYKIEKAVVYSFEAVPKYATSTGFTRIIEFNTPKEVIDSLEQNKAYYEIIVPVKKSWSEKRIQKEINNKWKEHYKNMPSEDIYYYRFYTPLLSEDKSYAIVRLDSNSGGSCFIFKKVNGEWIRVYKFRSWIS